MQSEPLNEQQCRTRFVNNDAICVTQKYNSFFISYSHLVGRTSFCSFALFFEEIYSRLWVQRM